MANRFLVAAALAIPVSLALCTNPIAAGGRLVDVELVFAVDASDSMEDWEWRLEMSGIAAAFRSKSVQ
jgi:hypothetical protein